MKFFTDKKYEQNIAHCEYEAYCRSIWASLPDDLKRIQEGMLPEDLLTGLSCIGLHDAKIIKFDESDEGIIIEFNTDNNGDLRKVWIEYKSGSVTERPKKNVLGSDVKNSHSDIMCHEIEITESGDYLHSLLFASNEKLIIEFSNVSVTHKDIE